MTELDKLLRDLAQPGVALELVVLAGCLALAFGICWAVGRKQPKDSIWFGRAVFDGVLFPLLALALTWIARRIVDDYQVVPVLSIAVPVLVSLVGIRFLARVTTVVFPASGVARLVERLFSWLAWMAAVLWIVGLLPDVMREMEDIQFAIGKNKISVLGIVQGVLSSGAMLVAALWVSATLERRVLVDTVSDLSLRKVASNAIRAVLLLVGLLFALSTVGVDLTALSVLGGALGVGLGFGLQKLAANYVSGFVILFERSLRIGDNVRVDGFEGRIADIKTRYTLVRANNGRESIVPNELLITQRVENLSQADLKFSITSDVTVGYGSDVATVQRVLTEAAAAQPRVLKSPEPVAFLAEFAPDGLQFTLNFWVSDPANGQLNLRSAINIAIVEGLRDAGIEIRPPQRVLQYSAQPTSSSTEATG
ncbi:MAG: mechanosensitive ion channel [Proteobacteria bacterium]|jgi:small-conductance mechanosensitive channel|nr:mechanosensitive ion channel [Ramlibacter sp.]MCA0212666.1 mechanosensitive ion channel [Pseudomonadota bacterium]